MGAKADKVKHLQKMIDEAIKNGQDLKFIQELKDALEHAKYLDQLYH